MQEIAKVTLENEMDLILAHKRSMKLAELAGLSLSAQTTFATAVSEVSRNPIENGRIGQLILSVDNSKREKYIVATLVEEKGGGRTGTGLEYAKRLVSKYNVSAVGTGSSIELFYFIKPLFRIDIEKLDEWRMIFRNEPSISPYEEIKRKIEQLKDLSERLQKSETQYKILTNTLPNIIFSMDLDGKVTFANIWMTEYTGETLQRLNETKWSTVVHPDDYDAFALLISPGIGKGMSTVRMDLRLKNHQTGEYLWHQLSLSPFQNDELKLQYWIGFIVDINAQKVYSETLRDNIALKQNQETLETSIGELNRSNFELQQFAFVASHDLQEPVRKLMFYSDFLIEKYAGVLDQRGVGMLSNIHAASDRMRTLIQDLLSLSQINKEAARFKKIDLNKVADEAMQDLEMAIADKNVKLEVQPLPEIVGDDRMLRQLFENIISNSIKYSKPSGPVQVSISCRKDNGSFVLSFRDNGIGFDEKYLPQMFSLFQRLHDRKAYEGTGLGLAICRKIVEMHQGSIWAESTEGQGATFYVSLPDNDHNERT